MTGIDTDAEFAFYTLDLVIQLVVPVQGQAAVMKKIPDITDQALKKALAEMERSIRDTKRESRATDERIAAMDSQRAQLTNKVSAAHDRSLHLKS